MNKKNWEEQKKRYAMFLREEGDFSCPYFWHEENEMKNEKEAFDLIKGLNQEKERAFLWEETSDFSCSQYRTKTYQNIRLLALEWAKNGNREGMENWLSDIIGAFDWMAKYGYQEGMEQTDNWWDWQIGIPLALLDCCFLLRKELGEERIKQACKTVEYFSGRKTLTNPIFTGANLVWTAMISAMCGLLMEEEEEIKEAKNAALKELHFVENGDGFYRDGSFIQHEKLAYTGGYGISFLDQMSRMMVLLYGTFYAFTREEYGMLCYFLEHAFFPVTVDGQIMDMVCGREISRYFMKENQAGKQLMDSMWRMACCVDMETSKWLLDRVEAWIHKANRPTQFVYFDHMDRAVCRRETYSAGLALYSSRIENYEAINDENKRGYHTGSGMLYLYPNGKNDYEGAFWCTADMDYLPGTTVIAASRPSHQHVQKSSFVGGAGLGTCGAVGMEVEEDAFHVRKSWFFFDDSIVCLGNDMVCRQGTLQTTVENRRFPEKEMESGENELWEEKVEGKTKWLYSRVIDEKDGRGVYFIKPASIKTKNELRRGSWTDINGCSPLDTVYQERYLKVWMNHNGRDEEENEYAYVIYPVVQKNDLMEREKDIELLTFDAGMHAVWQKRENRLAGVCWDVLGGNVTFQIDQYKKVCLRFFGPAVFVLEICNECIKISAKNPMNVLEPVSLELEGGIKGEIVSGATWRDGMESVKETPGSDGYSSE